MHPQPGHVGDETQRCQDRGDQRPPGPLAEDFAARTPRATDHEGKRNGRRRRCNETQEPGQPPLPAEQRQEPEGHAGDHDALGIDQTEHERAREYRKQQCGPGGVPAVVVVADEHADGHHSSQSRDPADHKADDQRREPGEVGKPADGEGKRRKEGGGVSGHVAVHHWQVARPSVKGPTDEPLPVPDIEVGAQRFVGEDVDGGRTGNCRTASDHVSEHGPEQEPLADPPFAALVRTRLRRERAGIDHRDGR